MKRMSRYGLVVLLSLLSGWVGHALGTRGAGAENQIDGSADKSSRERPIQGSPSDVAHKKRSSKDKIRALHARAETNALWEKLLSIDEWRMIGKSGNDLLEELIDREGEAVWKRLLEIPDERNRAEICDRALDCYAARDPWLAYEMFLKERGGFHPEWGFRANARILKVALKISADKYIEVTEGSGLNRGSSIFQGEFPAGFDFGKLVRHLDGSKTEAAGVPGNLIESWAAVSPLEVAEYFKGFTKMVQADNPDEWPQLFRKSYFDVPNILKNLAASKDASRDVALTELGRLLASDREGTWKQCAERDKGKLIPEMLDAASVMGQRDDYLLNALFTTRGQSVPDDSWKHVPPDERTRILDLAEKKWAEQANGPVDVRARERWRAMMEKAWAEL